MSNVIIIGSGPAGISASLYTIRASIDTTVISKGNSALIKAENIENYYGFSTPVTGQALEQSGIEGAKRLGVKFITEEVISISYEEKPSVKTNVNNYEADCILIATGSSRKTPKISGIAEFEGKGVSYCAVCDAFFYRGKDVAVLGNGEYAIHEAMELMPVAKSVTLLTNGLEPDASLPSGILLNTKKITSLKGGDRLAGVVFDDSSESALEGLFIALGVAGSTDLAMKIGALTEGNKIIVNENMETNIPGLFAAGDCTGGLLQVSKAVYEGAKAGTEMVKQARKR
jgi:thioredoxin reductase (NADPH)